MMINGDGQHTPKQRYDDKRHICIYLHWYFQTILCTFSWLISMLSFLQKTAFLESESEQIAPTLKGLQFKDCWTFWKRSFSFFQLVGGKGWKMANESHAPPSEKGLEQKIQGGEGYICAQCNKPFSHAGNLKRHLLIHAGEKKLKCMQCNYSTNEAGNLGKHTIIHSGDKDHNCAQCNKSFNQVSNLKTHLLTHTGEKKHMCTQCNYSANTAGNLKIHIKIHSGEKNHNCAQFKKSFTQASTMKTHLLIHTGEKKHRCTQCNYSAKQASDLRKHMITHSGAKNHKCAQCSKSFSLNGDLKRHLLIHTGGKKHMWTQCNYSATQAGDLRKHIKAHSGEKNHRCVGFTALIFDNIKKCATFPAAFCLKPYPAGYQVGGLWLVSGYQENIRKGAHCSLPSTERQLGS